MARDLSRLLRPKSVAVVGGGAWCEAVLTQMVKMGFPGDIWPVHPKRAEVAGFAAFACLAELPGVPDAVFIGVNRRATIEVVLELAAIGAGGAVCFASGFAEAVAEDAAGGSLEADLIAAAGNMPILGPNCYGFINYLDGALLWPDQHGSQRVDSGVAIITQSSNILINLTMQKRGLPIAYVAAVGNQAQTGFADIGMAFLDDPRVTALGLHIEGVGDLRAFEALAAKADGLGKSIVVIKSGRSEQARAATISHTASLAGGDAGASALFERLGMARVDGLPAFLETLKLLHVAGPLTGNRIATISCSGGEASLAADLAMRFDLAFPPLTGVQKTGLRATLGPMVALANPLDYHTYIWRDTTAMTDTFAAMIGGPLDLSLVIADFPREDRCDASEWECVVAAVIAAKARTSATVGLVTTLPELLPEDVAARLISGGVVPFHGLEEALAAAEAGAFLGRQTETAEPLLLPNTTTTEATTLSEAGAKEALSASGLRVPISWQAKSPAEAATAAETIGFPVVLKGEGLAHKSEAGAVRLNLTSAEEVTEAAEKMPSETFLVEEMLTDNTAELLIGVVRDPAHGFVLTLAAGGVLTELLEDSTSLLIPSTRNEIDRALSHLKINRLLNGFRGAEPANRAAILDAIEAVQNYVMANAGKIEEVEVNPLICGPQTAIAADALIRKVP